MGQGRGPSEAKKTPVTAQDALGGVLGSGRTVRVTMTLSEGLRDDLDFISRKLGLTRSAAVQCLLADEAHLLAVAMHNTASRNAYDVNEDVQSRRMRGGSVAFAREAIAQVRGVGCPDD